MKKNFGRVSRNESEEIRVWLQEVEGNLCVELRVYDRSAQRAGISLPEPEGLVVPVHVLWDLIQVLQQTHDHLTKEGLVDAPTMNNLVTGDDPIRLHLVVEPSDPQPDTGREPSVSIRMPLECYPLGAPDNWPSEALTGEITDLSTEHAQVCFPKQFAAGSRLAITRIGDQVFRAQTEVVGTTPHPDNGAYRHSLRWLSLSPQAKAALSKIIDSAK